MTKNSTTQFASNSKNFESFKNQGNTQKETVENENIVVEKDITEEIETKYDVQTLQQKYIQELEAKLAALQDSNKPQVSQSQPQTKENNSKSNKEKEVIAPEYEYEEYNTPEFKLSQDDYIKVMSLCADGWHLNLSTQGNGQGRIYKFSRFGEVKNIRYGDVNDIIEAHRNLMEAGRFYILDKNIIRHHGLDEFYSKVITKEKIDEIMAGSDNSLELYQSCNDKQKEMIVSMLTEKLRDNPNGVDLNVIEKIAKISGVKISEKADDSKNLQESLAEQNK